MNVSMIFLLPSSCLIVRRVIAITCKAVKFPYNNHIKVAFVAIFNHPLKLGTIICFGRQCAVYIGINNGHFVLFGKFHTFTELTVYTSEF